MSEHRPSFSELRAKTLEDYERFAASPDWLTIGMVSSLLLMGIAGIAVLLKIVPVSVMLLWQWWQQR